jgi:hypothetical protein
MTFDEMAEDIANEVRVLVSQRLAQNAAKLVDDDGNQLGGLERIDRHCGDAVEQIIKRWGDA